MKRLTTILMLTGLTVLTGCQTLSGSETPKVVEAAPAPQPAPTMIAPMVEKRETFMATGYAVFANGGYRVNPWVISRITDQELQQAGITAQVQGAATGTDEHELGVQAFDRFAAKILYFYVPTAVVCTL